MFYFRNAKNPYNKLEFFFVFEMDDIKIVFFVFFVFAMEPDSLRISGECDIVQYKNGLG